MIKLLAVDDEKGIVAFLKDFFELKGYTIFTAYNPKDAVTLVKKEHPQLVFLDIHMPQNEGLDVLREIKIFDKDIKVIMITAASDTDIRNKSITLGADSYIIKPFELARIEELTLKFMQDILKQKKKSS